MDEAHSSKLLTQCPLCQAAYLQADLRLLGEKGSTRLFHCTCRSCGKAMLAVILETHGSMSSVGLMTDLEAQDAIRFRDCSTISADECIGVHQFLSTESRRFCALLQQPKPGLTTAA